MLMFWLQAALALMFFATAFVIWGRGESVPPAMAGSYALLISILFAALAVGKLAVNQ